MTAQTALSAPSTTALERGRAVVAEINPGLEQALAAKYDAQFPDFAETLVEFAYGRLYAREGLDLKTRQIATVAALTALGGQTGPQLRVNLEHALAAGASRRELGHCRWRALGPRRRQQPRRCRRPRHCRG